MILHTQPRCDNKKTFAIHHENKTYFVSDAIKKMFVGPLQRVRPRNGILALGLVVLVVVLVLVPLRSEFIGEL